MSMPVTDPAFWRERVYVALARGEIHRLIFDGSLDQLKPFDDRLRAALSVVRGMDTVLDVGCGYGRALTLTPRGWRGEYHGVDASEDLVEVARVIHPDRRFDVAKGEYTLKACEATGRRFDWVVFGWMRTMLVDNGHADLWRKMEASAAAVARKGVIVVD